MSCSCRARRTRSSPTQAAAACRASDPRTRAVYCAIVPADCGLCVYVRVCVCGSAERAPAPLSGTLNFTHLHTLLLFALLRCGRALIAACVCVCAASRGSKQTAVVWSRGGRVWCFHFCTAHRKRLRRESLVCMRTKTFADLDRFISDGRMRLIQSGDENGRTACHTHKHTPTLRRALLRA